MIVENSGETPPSADPESRTGSVFSGLWSRFRSTPLVTKSLAFYERHDRYAPALFFFGGVFWDAATLQRVDAWFDNAFLLTYLAIAGFLTVSGTLVLHERTTRAWMLRYREWYPAALQFFLGALFSAYVIFYSQSASLSEGSVYLLILVGLLVGNEFIHRRIVHVYLQFSLYFLASATFFIFFIPVLTKTMNYPTFFASGLLSVILVGGMLVYLKHRDVFQNQRQFYYSLALVVTLFGMLNLFYLQSWIPPVPLAMRHGGIYHEVYLNQEDLTYELAFERPEWYEFWVSSDRRFHYQQGDTVWCFAAIFAPTHLKKKIYHNWRFFDEANGTWVSTDRIGNTVVGYRGRDKGWRGYTRKQHITPGRWRVDVETEEGLILGRIYFTIEPAGNTPVQLKRIVYR